MSSGMTFTEHEAIAYFFREYPDNMTLEQVLDAHAENELGVELWAMFEELSPDDINDAVNGLLHLIRRIKKQGAIL
jgi:hypothetical protein